MTVHLALDLFPSVHCLFSLGSAVSACLVMAQSGFGGGGLAGAQSPGCLTSASGSWFTGFRDSPPPSQVSRSKCARVSLRLVGSNHALVGKQKRAAWLREAIVGCKLLLGGQLLSSPVLHFAYTGLAHSFQ